MIPVNEPLLTGNEKKYLTECIDTGWISSDGPFVKEFEQKFSAWVGRSEGISVANGSAALDIAIQALRLGKGDEVIMPSFTIISPASSVVKAGAKPILVDSDPLTWNMDVSQIEAKITPNTKAIVVVHIYGLPVDMDPVLELVKKYNLFLIEDAAEMHGQTYKGRKCGTFGDLTIFSFYPNKHLTTGEGGMILTDNPALADRCRDLRNLCFLPGRRFIHEELGWNYRFTNMQAAIGLAQLEQLDEFIVKKRWIGNTYHELLQDIPVQRQPVSTGYADNIYWVNAMVLNDEVPFDADEVQRRLQAAGVGTRPFFWPMHEQPVFRNMGWYEGESYPVAERIARRGFYVPSGLAINREQIEQVAEIVKQVLK
jgi:perosamine synthetase